ncbi:glycoside hydrolase family 25 protein [Clostridium chrysemydis]|uniref:glycoside hydrolase family 25 protein n=1 Tax=Clostridium chrysemydis TaxID=2665504 RepID=UPI001884666F|nr:glycoside hydrolase family 25 protein [Clostridium chrysemydis]
MQDKGPKDTFGIDLNEYSQNVDFKVLASTIDFLYLRSSGSGSGKFREDKKFVEFAKQSRGYKIPVGAYHFGVPSYNLVSADEQCDDFIGILQKGFGNKNYGDLFPVLDVETPIENKLSNDAMLNWIDRFRNRFEKKTRRRLMLYTGTFFIDLYGDFKNSKGEQPLKNMPLWIAMYTNIPNNPPYPPNVGGWTRWRIWQYSENENVKGVGNPVDANFGVKLDLLTQPREVQGLKAYADNKFIHVTWEKNTDIDLLGYNIFVDGYWIGTVDKVDTSYKIPLSKIYKPKGRMLEIGIDAFDYDGESSKIRSKVKIEG